MAAHAVRDAGVFANSPLAVPTRRRQSRHAKSKRGFAPKGSKNNEDLFRMLMEHLSGLCGESGVSFDPRVTPSVRALTGYIAKPSQAWDWLLNDFEKARPDLFGAVGIQLSAAFLRGKLCAMWKEEAIQEARIRDQNRIAQNRVRYTEEREAHGGDAEFFNSNTWQRLRYEVLAEAGGACSLCGRTHRDDGVALEVDHIKPRSRFPNLALDKANLQPLCFDCNRGKGNRCTTDWRSHPQD